MGRGRLILFLLEVMLLAALAALAAIAHLRAEAVIGVMVFGWVVVALLEWSSWLDRPHFGRGLPPRFYVPQVSVPPPLAPQQTGAGRLERPARVEDAETWIVQPESWAPSFDEWPVIDLERLGDDTVIVATGGPGEDTMVVSAAGGPGEDTEVAAPGGAGGEAAAAQGLAPPAPPAPPEPAASADIVEQPSPPGTPAAAEPVPAPAPAAAPPEAPAAVAGPARSRHRVDPFTPSPAVSRRRRRSEEGGFVELPARPPSGRPLPSGVRAPREGGSA